MNVFDLQAKIGLDTKGYTSGLKSAGTAMKKVGGTLNKGFKTMSKIGVASFAAIGTASVATTKKIVDLANSTADYGDKVDKMSQKMGISAKAYQEWDAVMQHSGASIDSLKPSMKTLAVQAEKGNEAFQKLGISQKEVASLSQEDLFAKVITGLQDMGESTERTALASQLLGRGATELGALLNTSAKDTESMKKRVNELGGVMSNKAVKQAAKYKDTLQDMKTAFEGIKRTLGTSFMKPIVKIMEGLTDVFTGDDKGLGKIEKGIKGLLKKLNENLPKIIKFGKTVVGAIGDSILENLPSILSTGVDIIMSLINGIIEALPQIIDAGMQVIGNFAFAISEALPKLAEAGGEILDTLLEALTNDDNDTTDAGNTIIDNIMNAISIALENAPKIFELASTIIVKIVDAIKSYVEENGVEDIGTKIFDAIKAAISSAFEIIGALADLASTILSSIVDAISGLTESDWKKAGSDLVDEFEKLFKNIDWEDIWYNTWEIISKAMQGVVWFVNGVGESVFNSIKEWWDSEVATEENGEELAKDMIIKILKGLGKAAEVIFKFGVPYLGIQTQEDTERKMREWNKANAESENERLRKAGETTRIDPKTGIAYDIVSGTTKQGPNGNWDKTYKYDYITGTIGDEIKDATSKEVEKGFTEGAEKGINNSLENSDKWNITKKVNIAPYKDLGAYMSQGVQEGIESESKGYVDFVNKGIKTPLEDAIRKDFQIQSPAKAMNPWGMYIGQGLLAGILDPFKKIYDWLSKNIFNPFIKGVKGVFGIKTTSSDETKTIGEYIIEGLVLGLQDKISKVKKKIDDVFGKVIQWAKDVFDQSSPSKAFKKIGIFNVLGLEQGWEEEMPNFRKMVENDLAFDDVNTLGIGLNNGYIDSIMEIEKKDDPVVLQTHALLEDIKDMLGGIDADMVSSINNVRKQPLKVDSRTFGRAVRNVYA